MEVFELVYQINEGANIINMLSQFSLENIEESSNLYIIIN